MTMRRAWTARSLLVRMRSPSMPSSGSSAGACDSHRPPRRRAGSFLPGGSRGQTKGSRTECSRHAGERPARWSRSRRARSCRPSSVNAIQSFSCSLEKNSRFGDAPALPMRLTIECPSSLRFHHKTVGASPIMIGSLHKFERERDTLSATDAERNDFLADPVALHRMQETGRSNREHRARCADRVTMRDGAAFDIDDVFGKTARCGDPAPSVSADEDARINDPGLIFETARLRSIDGDAPANAVRNCGFARRPSSLAH